MAKKKAKAKAKKKFFSVVVSYTVKHFYRVQAHSAKSAKKFFEDGGNGLEFVAKVRVADKVIKVEEI